MRPINHGLRIGLMLLAFIVSSSAQAGEREALLGTMQAEMERNRTELKVDEYDLPYFIGYRIIDLRTTNIEASFGALIEDDYLHERKAAVDVRVGSYDFDSHPDAEVRFDFDSGFRPSKNVPIDGDPDGLRATLWLLTDAAYKKALSTYFKKKAKRVSTVKKTHVDSFSRETPIQRVTPRVEVNVDRRVWRNLAKSLSKRFRTMPGLMTGKVGFEVEHISTSIVNSEGTRALKEYAIYSVGISASARAEDGMMLTQGKTRYARSASTLPQKAELEAMVDGVMRDLAALRKAPVLDPYTGPAILEPEAAGVFFHETIGHRLEGERQNDEQEGQTFKGQIGSEILPAFIDVRDDPTSQVLQNVELNGHYPFDDQGVPASNVVLVDKGVLKTFLTSRTPLEKVSASNGHGRARGTRTPVARMGNLIVESHKVVSRKKLKEMLIAEAKAQGKPYGLIIADITGGSTNTSNYGYQAFKGTPRMVYRVDAETGNETLVRGVEMVGTPLTAINKLMAAGDQTGVFNGYCGAESGYVPVSAVAPSLLFREIELQRTQRKKLRAPILKAPWNSDHR